MSKKEKTTKTEKSGSFSKMFKTKAFRAGGYSTAAAAIIIVIAVIINLLVSSVSTAYTNIDTTGAGLYSISEQTKDMLKSLENDVTFYYIASEDAKTGYVKKLLDKYESSSKKLKVENINPDTNPEFSKKYTSDSVADGDIIVVCGEKSKVVHQSDMIQYEAGSYEAYIYYMQNGQQSNVYWNGEIELTKAIDFVTNNNSYNVYFLDYNGNSNFASLQTLLGNENITCADLTENADSIPDDASCVVLSDVDKDISEEQYNMLGEYLKKGGKLYISADYSDEDRPNLDKLLKTFGLSFTSATLEDGDSNYSAKNKIRPQYAGEHAIISPFSKANYICFPDAMGIDVKETENIKATPLLETSESSYLSSDESNVLHFKVFNLGVIAENTQTGAQLVVYGAAGYTSSEYIDNASYSNSDLFVNSIGYLCDKDSAITLHAKTVTSDNTLDFSRTSTGAIIFIIAILPAVAAVAAGFIIRYRRKNK